MRQRVTRIKRADLRPRDEDGGQKGGRKKDEKSAMTKCTRPRVLHKAGMCGLANHSRAFRGFKVEVKAHLSIHRLKFRLLGQCDGGGAGTSAYRARNAAALRKRERDSRRDWNEIAKSKEFYQKNNNNGN